MSFGLKQALTTQSKLYTSGISYGQKTDNTDYGQNIDGFWATIICPGTPDTEFAVPLGNKFQSPRIPIGFHVVNKNASCDIYASSTVWTSTNIYLKSTVASVTITLFIF